MFSTVWNSIFDIYYDIIAVFGNIADVLSQPIVNFIGEYSFLPNWLINFILRVIDDTTIGETSVLGFMLGSGLTIFIMFSVVKYFVSIL